MAYALSLTLNSERNYYENMIKNEVDFGSRLLRATAFCTFILNGIHNAHNHKLVSRKAVCALVLKGIRNRMYESPWIKGTCRVAYALSLTLNSQRVLYANMIKNEVFQIYRCFKSIQIQH